MGRGRLLLAGDPAHLEAMPTLGFDYDSTYCDRTARAGAAPARTCRSSTSTSSSLPMTLPMDHTLFEILGHTDGQVWHDKADH